MSSEGWNVAEGPIDSKGWGAVSVLRILCAEISTHHLGRKRFTESKEKTRIDKGQ